jgi:SsrA-binding protein
MERKIVTTNRKAFHDYSIIDKFEAGIVLAGYEVKSLRGGDANLADGYVSINGGQAFLENVHIAPYKMQSKHVIDYEPRRPRKLLMHKNEIIRLFSKTREKGLTIVPLELYFSPRGTAKLLLGLAKGKTSFDKRETLMRKDMKRDMEREKRNR